jgi:hypothetical protein
MVENPEGRDREMQNQEARDREQIDREMREREERDREMRDRERREEELRARERRERERFQERESERQRERERDRQRLRDYEPEPERERDAPRAYWEPFQFKDDFGRVTYASARAGADIFSGMAQVLGSLLGNLKDSFLPGRYGYRRGDEERDLDDRERGYGRRRRSSAGRTYDARADVRSAARDAADVVARAAEDFADYYDRTLYDDREERRERRGERSRRRSSEG